MGESDDREVHALALQALFLLGERQVSGVDTSEVADFFTLLPCKYFIFEGTSHSGERIVISSRQVLVRLFLARGEPAYRVLATRAALFHKYCRFLFFNGLLPEELHCFLSMREALFSLVAMEMAAPQVKFSDLAGLKLCYPFGPSLMNDFEVADDRVHIQCVLADPGRYLRCERMSENFNRFESGLFTKLESYAKTKSDRFVLTVCSFSLKQDQAPN